MNSISRFSRSICLFPVQEKGTDSRNPSRGIAKRHFQISKAVPKRDTTWNLEEETSQFSDSPNFLPSIMLSHLSRNLHRQFAIKLFTAVLLLIPLIGFSQTNQVISYISLQGKDYFNLKIIAANPAYVDAEDEHANFLRFATSNFPEPWQKKFNYSPANATQFLANQKNKIQQAHAANATQQIAYERYAASLVGTNQVIRLIALINESTMRGVLVETDDKQILINNLPQSVKDFLRREQQLKYDVADYQTRVDIYQNKADLADANAPIGYSVSGDANYVAATANALAAQRNQANQMELIAAQSQKKLDNMKTDLIALELSAAKNTTIMAYSTGQNYGGYEIWNCSGMAPIKK